MINPMPGPMSPVRLIRIERDGVKVAGIDIGPGEHVTGVRIVFAYGTGIVRGQVIVKGGNLPEGTNFFVSARRSDGSSEGASARSDLRGSFVLEKLPPGQYELVAQPSPSSNVPLPPELHRRFAAIRQSVTVANGQTVTVTLYRRSHPAGTEAVMKKLFYLNARFLLELLRVPLILSVFTFPALIPGQTRLAVRTGAIIGRVLTEDGSTVDGASVFCVSVGSDSQTRTTTADEEGQFSFAGLTPAPYRISARAPGYVLATTVGVEGQVARIGDTLILALVKGGVITGRVTNASGAPVVAVQVMARRVRDAEGRLVRSDPFSRIRPTDDRGIYRLFGLTAGAYHVVANPMSGSGLGSLYNLETSTYFPSSNRDGATEVRVQAGEEVSGIDIAYGGGRGHTISGTVEGASSGLLDYGMAIELQPAGGGRPVGSVFAQSRAGVMSFIVNGVTDGDYVLVGNQVR